MKRTILDQNGAFNELIIWVLTVMNICMCAFQTLVLRIAKGGGNQLHSRLR